MSGDSFEQRLNEEFGDSKKFQEQINGRLFSVETDFFEIHDRVTGVQIVFYSELKKPLQEYVVEEKE